MNLLKLLENKKKYYKLKTGTIVSMKLSDEKNKIINFEGLIISIKKKNNLIIIRKINNIYFKLSIKIDSPLLKNFKVIKILKNKRSKIYKNFNYFY